MDHLSPDSPRPTDARAAWQFRKCFSRPTWFFISNQIVLYDIKYIKREI